MGSLVEGCTELTTERTPCSDMAKFAVLSGLLVLLSGELALALKFLDENGKELPKLDGTLDEPEGFDDPRIRDLLTANDLSKNVSFRCGMFYAPESGDVIKPEAKPKAKIFILPKRFKIEKATFDEVKDIEYSGKTCSDMTNGKPEEDMEKYCTALFQKFVENNNMETGSKVRDPKAHTMGDDFCEYLTKVGVPIKRAPPNKKYPDGINVGFYYNKCNDKKWYDTQLRMTEKVCCSISGDTLVYDASKCQ